MSIRKSSFAPGEFFHIYNRGNNKREIFHDRKDYERFLFLIFAVNTKLNIISRLVLKEKYEFDRGELIVSVGAYCLMPNHFHLLLTENEEGGISKFMQKLSTAYSMYYNEKYKKTGGLFEGKFKSEHANNDKYLKYLFSYIHLNPVKLIERQWRKEGIRNKNKVQDFLKKYPYSSFPDYFGISRSENFILNRKSFPDYFPKSSHFINEISDWISYNNN